jgi:hypothetical protein
MASIAADSSGRIEIASSRGKLFLLVIGAVLFVAGALWLFSIAEGQNRFAPIYVKGVSVFAMAFFGLCGIYAFVKLFDSSPGLVLDSEGLIDNSSAIAAGRVAWREIRDIQVMAVSGQRFLAFVVDDPGKYLSQGNVLRRCLVKWNYRLYGTPVFISANALKLRFEDLEKIVREYRGKYGHG